MSTDEKKQLRHFVEAAAIYFDDDESFTESDVEATKLLCKFAPKTIDFFVTSKFGMAQPERINDDICKVSLFKYCCLMGYGSEKRSNRERQSVGSVVCVPLQEEGGRMSGVYDVISRRFEEEGERCVFFNRTSIVTKQFIKECERTLSSSLWQSINSRLNDPCNIWQSRNIQNAAPRHCHPIMAGSFVARILRNIIDDDLCSSSRSRPSPSTLRIVHSGHMDRDGPKVDIWSFLYETSPDDDGDIYDARNSMPRPHSHQNPHDYAVNAGNFSFYHPTLYHEITLNRFRKCVPTALDPITIAARLAIGFDLDPPRVGFCLRTQTLVMYREAFISASTSVMRINPIYNHSIECDFRAHENGRAWIPLQFTIKTGDVPFYEKHGEAIIINHLLRQRFLRLGFRDEAFVKHITSYICSKHIGGWPTRRIKTLRVKDWIGLFFKRILAETDIPMDFLIDCLFVNMRNNFIFRFGNDEDMPLPTRMDVIQLLMMHRMEWSRWTDGHGEGRFQYMWGFQDIIEMSRSYDSSWEKMSGNGVEAYEIETLETMRKIAPGSNSIVILRSWGRRVIERLLFTESYPQFTKMLMIMSNVEWVHGKETMYIKKYIDRGYRPTTDGILKECALGSN